MKSADQKETIEVTHVKQVLRSQYLAALATLREVIEKCPDELWYNDSFETPVWQIAYHAVFFAHSYSRRSDAEFDPWSKHQANVQYPDGIPGPPDPESDKALVADPYSREDVLEYCDFCRDTFDAVLESTDVSSMESGFWWYKVSKLEHLLVNIRHIQHHAAQLADRLRVNYRQGINWHGATR